jgi:diguanylate cyclase
MLDSLTQAYNRRAIQYLMEKEIARSGRANLPISILMIDVDRFKSINDTHGHAAGDVVLKYVAKTAAGQLRDQDLIGRYGGDEFLVVLPDTTELEALKIAERMRSKIEQTEIVIGKRSVTTTLSIGVAELDRNAPDQQELIRRADAAMYESKNRGSNRVQLAHNG